MCILQKCCHQHVLRSWCSQPEINGTNLGDVAISSAIILSGNNLKKMALFAKAMNLAFVCETNFYNIQSVCVAPAVETYWQELLDKNRNLSKGKEIVVMGK